MWKSTKTPSPQGETVLLADDLLATGGTAAAALHLIEELGGKVLGSVFFVELAFLNGRDRLTGTGPSIP
jgi:adenine phosphoribosyltransferase